MALEYYDSFFRQYPGSSRSTPNAASRMRVRRSQRRPRARPPTRRDSLGGGRGGKRRDRTPLGRDPWGFIG
jgi:hypothetical protein